MTIRDHITPYDRYSWEAVKSAFCEYLSLHKTHAIQVRQNASKQAAKTLDALETYRQEYKQSAFTWQGRLHEYGYLSHESR